MKSANGEARLQPGFDCNPVHSSGHTTERRLSMALTDESVRLVLVGQAAHLANACCFQQVMIRT